MSKEIDFYDPRIEDSRRAFAVSLLNMFSQNPKYLLLLDELEKTRGLDSGWKEIYDELQKPGKLDLFRSNILKAQKTTDWTRIEETAIQWAKFGWIIDGSIMPVSLWNECPQTQQEADQLVLSYMSKAAIMDLWGTIVERTKQRSVFDEACKCFENRCYTASASLLVSLIDGLLIRAQGNNQTQHKKTGVGASQKVYNAMESDPDYGLPGFFHLELLNFNAYMDMLFEKANNFNYEPKRLNRNFLHHGMSKRKVLRKDCIKLFIAYSKAIRFCNRI